MPHRRLPVRPDLAAITGEVDALVHGMLAGDAGALLEWREHHPAPTAPPIPTLEDARLVIARAYQAPDWPRLVHACTLADAIWHDDVAQESLGLAVTTDEMLAEQVKRGAVEPERDATVPSCRSPDSALLRHTPCYRHAAE